MRAKRPNGIINLRKGGLTYGMFLRSKPTQMMSSTSLIGAIIDGILERRNFVW